MQVRFIPSQRMSVQGKQSEIYKNMERNGILEN